MKNINPKLKRILKIFIIILGIIVLIYIFIFSRKSTPQNLPTPLPTSKFNIGSIAPIKISPITSTTGFEKGEIYGINKTNGNLIHFKENRQTIIYTGNINDYYIQGNIALIIDEAELSDIIVLNLDTKSQRRLSFDTLSPIISVTLSDDLKTVYFLSGFNVDKKVSSIHSVPIGGGQPTKLGETRAQTLRFLKNNNLLLFQSVHEPDASTISLFDISKNNQILSQITNSFQLSPDKNHLLLQTSNTTKIINLNNLEIKSKLTSQSSRSVWKDTNTVILFRNTNQGATYASLTLDPFELSNFQSLSQGSAIMTAFGFIENTLFWQDYNNNILNTEISTTH